MIDDFAHILRNNPVFVCVFQSDLLINILKPATMHEGPLLLVSFIGNLGLSLSVIINYSDNIKGTLFLYFYFTSHYCNWLLFCDWLLVQ